MKCSTSPRDLPIGGTNFSPLGPKLLANTPILFGYYNLEKHTNVKAKWLKDALIPTLTLEGGG